MAVLSSECSSLSVMESADQRTLPVVKSHRLGMTFSSATYSVYDLEQVVDPL
jgi:hypothetical protein